MITTETGGIGEAVGNTAFFVPASSPAAIADALDLALSLPEKERRAMAGRARAYELQFDRTAVFDRLLARLPRSREPEFAPLLG